MLLGRPMHANCTSHDICAISRGICPGIQRRYPGHRANFCKEPFACSLCIVWYSGSPTWLNVVLVRPPRQ